jgi:hypothetical protein
MSLKVLGYDLQTFVKPIASIICKHPVGEFDVQATSDGLGIRICIVTTLLGSTGLSTWVKILEIFPSSSASFIEVAEFSFAYRVRSYTLNKDLFAYNWHNHVGVHNFIADKAVAWAVPDEHINHVREHITI